jgi:mannose-6-phosphate isomerase-like protein (cupin superfamily)
VAASQQPGASGLRPYMLKAGEGVSAGDSSTKASVASTGGGLTLIESRTTGGAPLHVHTREDEYFYVVEGAISVHCGDETYEAGTRSFVFLPRGIPHEWDVVGEEATILMLTVPAALDEFLGEYHAAPSREARDAIAERYGITFLPNERTNG